MSSRRSASHGSEAAVDCPGQNEDQDGLDAAAVDYSAWTLRRPDGSGGPAPSTDVVEGVNYTLCCLFWDQVGTRPQRKRPRRRW